jgi:hypothetical protein
MPAAPAFAQSATLQGRAVDADGRPVANLEVLMHRVAGGSGANVARDTTDDAGAFTLTAPTTPDDSAVYFAATRYRDELFVGAFVRLPFASDPEYRLEVGGQPFSLAGPATPTGPIATSPVSPRRRWLAAVPLLGLAMFAAAAGLRAARPPAHRRLLLRLAVLDEDQSGEDDGRERERIMEQLLAR